MKQKIFKAILMLMVFLAGAYAMWWSLEQGQHEWYIISWCGVVCFELLIFKYKK